MSSSQKDTMGKSVIEQDRKDPNNRFVFRYFHVDVTEYQSQVWVHIIGAHRSRCSLPYSVFKEICESESLHEFASDMELSIVPMPSTSFDNKSSSTTKNSKESRKRQKRRLTEDVRKVDKVSKLSNSATSPAVSSNKVATSSRTPTTTSKRTCTPTKKLPRIPLKKGNEKKVNKSSSNKSRTLSKQVLDSVSKVVERNEPTLWQGIERKIKEARKQVEDMERILDERQRQEQEQEKQNITLLNSAGADHVSVIDVDDDDDDEVLSTENAEYRRYVSDEEEEMFNSSQLQPEELKQTRPRVGVAVTTAVATSGYDLVNKDDDYYDDDDEYADDDDYYQAMEESYDVVNVDDVRVVEFRKK